MMMMMMMIVVSVVQSPRRQHRHIWLLRSRADGAVVSGWLRAASNVAASAADAAAVVADAFMAQSRPDGAYCACYVDCVSQFRTQSYGFMARISTAQTR